MSHELVLIAAAGLAISIAAAVFARRTGVAAPLLLVAFGIGASLLPGTPTLGIEPELILAGVLPPLLYASAVQLPVIDLRRNLSLITWLSVVMVIVSALVVGLLVHLVFPAIPLGLGIALGAVVSPTDAVAATAVGRRVGLPPRLMTILEGESLVNDASALVVLRTALAAIGTGSAFSLGGTIGDFAWAVVGAGLVGWLVAWVTALVRQRLDDPVLNTTISFITPFLAYVPAEEIHASGVLAVVVAGLVTGAMGARRFSARDRQTQTTTWATINFILESGVFLALGYELPVLVDDARAETSVGQVVGMVSLVLVTLVVLRAAGLAWPALTGRFGRGDRNARVRERLDLIEQRVEGWEPKDDREETRLHWARRRIDRASADIAFEEREPITARGHLILAWAGMRGVVTLAAAQTIPTETAHRDTVVLVACLVAMVSLALFGLTLPALIRRLDLPSVGPARRRDEVLTLMRQIGEDATDALGPLDAQTIDGEPLDPAVVTVLKDRFLPMLLSGVRSGVAAKPGQREQAFIIQRRYLDALREGLLRERSVGAFSTETYKHVEAILDREEQRLGSPG
ncbi:cation:proton antiporter [Nocardioides nitrophenolicus]|uniref:cation:proton antiporter n=1 Tax=Nocardioides nitrophenolicus TaxID=60489 RepID=UPI00195D94FA|nr:sodium:proton antiporter [Nocardioides nitrophenolicus]MBM7518015.1 CPA1 family monovalent cation:H+ antiporter [Nocardioides nitrophenolicus]